MRWLATATDILEGNVTTLAQIARELLDDEKTLCRLIAFDGARSRLESPIESKFWHMLEKTAFDKFDKLDVQVQCGRYRIDVLIVLNGYRLGIELDGKEFHEDEADAIRDAWLFDHNYLDEIIRIPGYAIHWYPHGTMRVLMEWHPALATPTPGFVMSVEEFREEFEAAKETLVPHSFTSIEAWLDWAEPNYDIWFMRDNWGLVWSPRRLIRLEKLKPIRRIVRVTS